MIAHALFFYECNNKLQISEKKNCVCLTVIQQVCFTKSHHIKVIMQNPSLVVAKPWRDALSLLHLSKRRHGWEKLPSVAVKARHILYIISCTPHPRSFTSCDLSWLSRISPSGPSVTEIDASQCEHHMGWSGLTLTFNEVNVCCDAARRVNGEQ